MKSKPMNKAVAGRALGEALRFEQLRALAGELRDLREAPPIVTVAPGRREGEILGFVRGLRLSAQVAYFLRDALSDTALEVSWAHLLDDTRASCSPECDIVIHTKGYVRKWNGNDRPIMEFKFIDAKAAKAVVSCKATLSAIDRDYPSRLKKYGVKKVFLFAECCEEKRFAALVKSAKEAGYAGLYCLYFTLPSTQNFKMDPAQYVAFDKDVRKAVGV